MAVAATRGVGTQSESGESGSHHMSHDCIFPFVCYMVKLESISYSTLLPKGVQIEFYQCLF